MRSAAASGIRRKREPGLIGCGGAPEGGAAVAPFMAAEILRVTARSANARKRPSRGFGAFVTQPLGCAASAARERTLTHGTTMNHRSLGHSGLKVSELSLGSWTTLGGSVGSADAGSIVRRAFDLGINLFDTADVYVKGGAERALAAAIRDLPR